MHRKRDFFVVAMGGAIASLVMLTTLISCDSKEQAGSEEPEIHRQDSFSWITDSAGTFTTNDLARAQQEVPFIIILPAYLPPGFYPDPLIRGTLNDRARGDSAEVLLNYRTGESWKGMIIMEENTMLLPPDPALNPECKTIRIAGTEITQCASQLSFPRPEETLGFEFYWNQSGIRFGMSIYGYEYDEAIKVVESIIRQSL